MGNPVTPSGRAGHSRSLTPSQPPRPHPEPGSSEMLSQIESERSHEFEDEVKPQKLKPYEAKFQTVLQ